MASTTAMKKSSWVSRMLKLPVEVAPADLPLGSLYRLSMSPLCPLLFALVYILVTMHYNRRRRGGHQTNYLKGPAATAFVLAHNIALAVFSGWTFYRVAPAVASSLARGYAVGGKDGFKHAWCDSDDTLWRNQILRYGFLFYLSKFYEVIDTVIILAKGNRVKILQTYHHAGAMLAMYSGIRWHATPILFFVVFNSFIHTIMYSYYTFSVLKWPFPRVLKQSLTTLQIMQFVIGGSLAATYFFLNLPKLNAPGMVREAGKCITNEGASFAVWLNIIYLLPLTGLFISFYVKSYSKPKATKKID